MFSVKKPIKQKQPHTHTGEKKTNKKPTTKKTGQSEENFINLHCAVRVSSEKIR